MFPYCDSFLTCDSHIVMWESETKTMVFIDFARKMWEAKIANLRVTRVIQKSDSHCENLCIFMFWQFRYFVHCLFLTHTESMQLSKLNYYLRFLSVKQFKYTIAHLIFRVTAFERQFCYSTCFMIAYCTHVSVFARFNCFGLSK